MELGVSLLQERGDYIGALWATRLGSRLRRLAIGFRLPALGFLGSGFGALGIRLGALGFLFLARKFRCLERQVLSLRFRGRLGLVFLEDEHGIFLVAFGREADVVELDLVAP